LKRNTKLSLAIESVFYASLSYDKGAFLTDDLKSDSFKNDSWIWHFDNEDKILFLSFRGTDDLVDLLKDMSIFPSRLKGVGYLHGGFLSSSKSILNYCLPQLNHAKERGFKIVLSGHSYGGAIAQVIQQLLRTQHRIDSECVTFGSPRVWLPRAKPKGLHLRVQIDSDPVTKMPFIFGWVFRIFKHKSSDMLCVKTPDYFNFKNHKISTYEKLLEKELGQYAKSHI
jgi:hypothetical protein